MVCNHMTSPAGNFCILDSPGLLLVHSQVLEYDHKYSQIITVPNAFSGI